MRRSLFVVSLVLLVTVSEPAVGQLRTDAAISRAPVQLYGQDGPAFSLNRFFSPEHFRMSHSVEMTTGGGFGAYGGSGGTLAMYTNSMMWQFSNKLAARVDIAAAYSPTAGFPGMSTTGNQSKVFLRNAELAFRPKENMMLHLSIRQSPYGSYMSPYGMYGYDPGYSGFYDAGAAGSRSNLFWNSRLR